jgi:hypothetical protein
MFLKKCLSVVKPGLRVIFEDLRAFNAPALLLALGSCCTLLLHTWGSIYITCIMAVCTLLVYLAARKCGGWGQTFLGVVFSFFMVVVGLAAVAIRFFLYPDFSPNGKDSYTYVRRDFFLEEIPDTAYDVQVWSRVGFGPGEDEAYLSYHDTKANIRPYAAMARERSEMRTRIPRINDLISVPKVRVDETAVVPRFEALPLWQHIFIDYVPHPAEVGVLKEKFVFYVWGMGDGLSHPQANIVGISEDGTHIIFYWVGG